MKPENSEKTWWDEKPPIFKTWRAHLGVDYAAAQGTPVRSVGLGVVESAGNMGGYGNAVVIRHNNGHSTVYAHLSKMLVKRGQSVAQGQTVGMVGETVSPFTGIHHQNVFSGASKLQGG